MYCGAVIYHNRTCPALKSCNLFHRQLFPCVNAAISLNKHQQEREMLFIGAVGDEGVFFFFFFKEFLKP